MQPTMCHHQTLPKLHITHQFKNDINCQLLLPTVHLFPNSWLIIPNQHFILQSKTPSVTLRPLHAQSLSLLKFGVLNLNTAFSPLIMPQNVTIQSSFSKNLVKQYINSSSSNQSCKPARHPYMELALWQWRTDKKSQNWPISQPNHRPTTPAHYPEILGLFLCWQC